MDRIPTEWTKRGEQAEIGIGREILELRQEALVLCSRPEPKTSDLHQAFGGNAARWAWSGTVRLAIALGDLDLAREIDPVDIRTRTCVHILREQGDHTAIRQMTRMNERITDPVIHDLTVKALAETVNDRELLREMAGQIKQVEDDEIRDRLLGRLGYQLKDPAHLKGIKSAEERIYAFSAVATQTKEVGLATEALRLAMLEESPELMYAPSDVAFHFRDQRFYRRVLKVVGRIEAVEARIVAMDLLGGSNLRNKASRIAYHLIQSLPEYEPDIEDGFDWAAWEGTRVAPLAGMARRHLSVGLARRIQDKVFRSRTLNEIACELNDLPLTKEITDPDDRLSAQITIAGRTGRLDVIDDVLREIRGSGGEEEKRHLVDALATKIGILRHRAFRQLRLDV